MMVNINAFPSPDKDKIKHEFFVLADLLRQAMLSAESYPIIVPVETNLWLDSATYEILQHALSISGWYLTRTDYSMEKFHLSHCSFGKDDTERKEDMAALPPYNFCYQLEPTREIILGMIKESLNVC
jgi:hypothetical protein